MEMSLTTTIGLTIVGTAGVIGFFVMCTTAIIMDGRKDRHRQEIEHERRMKALELGRTLSEDRKSTCLPSSPAILLGLGTASTTFPFALIANLMTDSGATPWIAATAVSALGLICGTVLILFKKTPGPQTSESETGDEFSSHAKLPAFDPDAFDLVGSRS